MARSNKLVAEEALKIFWDKRDNCTYLHGSTGLRVNNNTVIANSYYKGKTESTQVKNYFDYFKSQGKIASDITWDNWQKTHNGKSTYDCSNSVLNYLVYGWKADGSHEIGCNSCWSSNAPQKWTQVAKDKVKVGMVAWKSGHVGLVIHKNPLITIDIPTYNNTFRKLNITTSYPDYWTGFAQFPSNFVTYDYDGEVYEEPTSKATLTVTLRAGLKAGYTCVAKDFTVTYTDENGKVYVNPTNWGAVNTTTNSLKLVAGVNKFSVGYKNCIYTFDYNVVDDTKYYTVKFTESDIKQLKTLCPNIKVE